MSNNKFSKISSIIQDAKKGKMFILVDDKNRENEGDLIIPGSKCNSKIINFMACSSLTLIAMDKHSICAVCMNYFVDMYETKHGIQYILTHTRPRSERPNPGVKLLSLV